MSHVYPPHPHLSSLDPSKYRVLRRDTNQSRGIAQYAIDFLKSGSPSLAVIKRTELFHTDSVVAAISAIALNTNAPKVLREEALEAENPKGAKVFGSSKKCSPSLAILANVSAVREWDTNGTVFGYNSKLGEGHRAGEFGHNDFYPVAVAACQMRALDGSVAVRAMIAIDEIRGRLAEVFSLKTFHIDHVVHGAIASAAVYGAIMGATARQIEYAIGMVVAHYIPFRAIRAGEQLSDSKGASAALSTEVAILSVHRCMRGFIGPADIFRNPEAIFRKFKPTHKKADGSGDAPFDLVLTFGGDDFAVMGMHFKLGLYEHQSAGAIQGVITLLAKHPNLWDAPLKSIKVVAYQPAFGIIGDPHKRHPTTRQSADHSMVFILARLLKKAKDLPIADRSNDENALWQKLIMTPYDFSRTAIADPNTRKLMEVIEFAHGGPSYDEKYPEGIPTSIQITTDSTVLDSGLIMFPAGHAANSQHNLEAILKAKFLKLGEIANENAKAIVDKLEDLHSKTAEDIQNVYLFDIQYKQTKRPKEEGKKNDEEEEEADQEY